MLLTWNQALYTLHVRTSSFCAALLSASDQEGGCPAARERGNSLTEKSDRLVFTNLLLSLTTPGILESGDDRNNTDCVSGGRHGESPYVSLGPWRILSGRFRRKEGPVF